MRANLFGGGSKKGIRLENIPEILNKKKMTIPKESNRTTSRPESEVQVQPVSKKPPKPVALVPIKEVKKITLEIKPDQKILEP